MTARPERPGFPGFGALHELSDPPPYPGARGMAQVQELEGMYGRLRGGRGLLGEVIEFRVDGPAPLDDFLWLGEVAGALVGRRVVDLFEAEGFTGWSTYAVRVVDAQGKEVEGYHGLGVTGRCGTLDFSASERLSPEGSQDPYVRCRGCRFDPGSWDGSDLFLWEPEPDFELWADYPFVTGRVARALERERVSGALLRRLDEMELYVPAEVLASDGVF